MPVTRITLRVDILEGVPLTPLIIYVGPFQFPNHSAMLRYIDEILAIRHPVCLSYISSIRERIGILGDG